MALLVLAMGVIVSVVFLLSFCIVRHFSDPLDSSAKVILTNALTLTLALLASAVTPLDVYATSLDLPGAIFIRHAYFVIFALVILWVFLVVPFNYFYTEEETDIDAPLCERVANAAKYTTFFFVFFLIVCLVGLALRPGHKEWATAPDNPNAKWIRDVFDLEHAGEAALMFCTACLICGGLVGWVYYAGYGVVALPIALIRGNKGLGEMRADVEKDLSRVRERIRELQSRSRKRRAEVIELRELSQQLRVLSRTDDSLGQQRVGCVAKLLALLAPFRVALGVALLAIGLAVVASTAITSADRALHSPCGLDCGFALATTTFYNPIDAALVAAAPHFPADYALFALLVGFLFVATLYAVLTLGIRVLCVPVARVKPRATGAQTMLVVCALVMVTLLALNLQLLTMAPQYATFGSQTALLSDAHALDGNPTLRAAREASVKLAADAGVASLPGAAGAGPRGKCTLGGDHPEDACLVTSMAKLLHSITAGMPVFAVIFYFSNWAFLAVSVATAIHTLFFKRRDIDYEELFEDDFEPEANPLLP